MILKNKLFNVLFLNELLGLIKSSDVSDFDFSDYFYNLVDEEDFNIIKYVDDQATNYRFEPYEFQSSDTTSFKDQEDIREDSLESDKYNLRMVDEIIKEKIFFKMNKDKLFSLDSDESCSESVKHKSKENLSDGKSDQMDQEKKIEVKRKHQDTNLKYDSLSLKVKGPKRQKSEILMVNKIDCILTKYKDQLIKIKNILEIDDTIGCKGIDCNDIMKYCYHSDIFEFHNNIFVENLEFEEKITEFCNTVNTRQLSLESKDRYHKKTSFKNIIVVSLFKTFNYNISKHNKYKDAYILNNVAYFTYLNIKMCNIIDTVKTVSLDSFRSYYLILNEIQKFIKKYKGLPEIFSLEVNLRINRQQDGYLGIYILLKVMNKIVETSLDHEKIYLCYLHICILLDLQTHKLFNKNIQNCKRRKTIYSIIETNKLSFFVILLSVWEICPSNIKTSFRRNINLNPILDVQKYAYLNKNYMFKLFLLLNIFLYNNNFNDLELGFLHLKEKNIETLADFLRIIQNNVDNIDVDNLRNATCYIYDILFNKT